MKPIDKAWLIQIEITNACHLRCAHCTRAVPHVRKPYFASLEHIEKALKSLEGWKRGVGCMGGEPTLHPQFPQVCALFRSYFPKNQCGIFTSGGKLYEKHKDLIHETFGIIHYNDHHVPGVHQPMMVASKDVVKDEKLRNELIDKCWLQSYWSPSITPKGAFFCEVAGTFDLIFDGPGGYPIEPGWWKRSVEQFQDQRERYCTQCSIPIPMKKFPTDHPCDLVSVSNARKLEEAGSPMARRGQLQVVNFQYTRKNIRSLQKQADANNAPFVHTVPDKEHCWFKAPNRYKVIALLDRLRMAFGIN